MGLFDLFRWILGRPPRTPYTSSPLATASPAGPSEAAAVTPAARTAVAKGPHRAVPDQRQFRQEALKYTSTLVATPSEREIVSSRPYHFAWPGPRTGEYLDLSTDADERWLQYYGLPNLQTPDDLAKWLGIPIGTLAWLTWRTVDGHRPVSESSSHYTYNWIQKRSGGWRLIEAPKEQLQAVQTKILREILDRIPPHPAAHGFIHNRSILSNAVPHVGQRFLLKFDLQDFYTTVRYSRVVAIYRSLGFSREVAIWLARLTTAAVPWNLKFPTPSWSNNLYLSFHLPQGAPTSPALANLSAYALDVRLAGMAAIYGMKYTRYADDLTFSGPGQAVPALREVIPFAKRIIRAERFTPNLKKTKILRNCQRQLVTGVVVNEHPNYNRRDFDALKAILHNCRVHGPSSQNQEQHPDFAAHLRGRVAHVIQLNEPRGQKLLAIYDQIDWSR